MLLKKYFSGSVQNKNEDYNYEMMLQFWIVRFYCPNEVLLQSADNPKLLVCALRHVGGVRVNQVTTRHFFCKYMIDVRLLDVNMFCKA